MEIFKVKDRSFSLAISLQILVDLAMNDVDLPTRLDTIVSRNNFLHKLLFWPPPFTCNVMNVPLPDWKKGNLVAYGKKW